MTLRDFAQRVLFSADLAGKLQPPPENVSDDCRGQPLAAPESPGRPPELRLARASSGRADFPSEHQLRDEPSRGRLLHFFANHELLATELMALALLKFPDAPAAFRRGLLHTLAEEQRHAQWYIDRMRAYGIAFGEFPVNGFFWNAVAGMETPLDYVTRLPLTFEQANLDFSLHYRDVFQRAGDPESATLFERIHEDEIGHVSYGLRWFRKWKSPADDDWEVFERRLIFPLSPARAKGKPPLDVAGRRRAGLADDFIRRLELFSRSRGRTPRVYWFNPLAEFQFISAGKDRASEALARDLDLLPIVLALREDILLVRHAPRRDHLHKLRNAGFDLPEIELLTSEGTLAPDSLTRHRKLGGLRPWAWAPDADRVLGPLVQQVGGPTRGFGWNQKMRELFSKVFGAEVLRALDDPDAGVVVGSVRDLRSATQVMRSRGYREVVLKPAFGLAGRGHRRIHEVTAADEMWAEQMFSSQGHLIAEPWLDRVADFSVQCEADPEGVLRLKGFTSLETTATGRFVACAAVGRFASLFAPAVARYFHGNGRGPWLRDFYEQRLFPILAPRFRDARFHGAFGIDAFVFRDATERLHLRPVVEVNPRFTMGRIAWELLRLAAPHRRVRFSLATMATARAQSCRSLTELATLLETNDPLVLDHVGAQRRLDRGTMVLNDALRAQRFLAVAQVAGIPKSLS